jgi:glycosyltransferase involved in cell wall biosynthesis
MTKCLVVLTLNEIDAVGKMHDKIPWNKYDEVFVIDGGSIDGTAEFYKEKGIRVETQPKKGRGIAFMLGAQFSVSDLIVYFSPDGNEDPGDIDKIFAELEAGNDMVIASRFMKGSRNEEDGHIFPFRKWVNKVFTLAVNTFFNRTVIYMTDTINGFRGIRRDRFQELNLSAEGFAIEFQISIRAMKKVFKIKEIPTIEGDRIGGKSKAKSIPTGLKLLRVFVDELFDKKNMRGQK